MWYLVSGVLLDLSVPDLCLLSYFYRDVVRDIRIHLLIQSGHEDLSS